VAEPSYLTNAYLTRLETSVREVGETGGLCWAVLEDTIFYPEGGGQPADRGSISGVEVVDVQKSSDTICHVLRSPVSPGPALLELDWERRWDHMQQHTAQHLLTAVALRDFGWRTTAFHLGPEASDIELDVPGLDRAAMTRLEEACQREVLAARPVRYRAADVHEFEDLGVRSRRLPEGFRGTVRLVEIAGLDLNTCGGTHVRSTAELGTLSLLSTESMRGGTRLFFVAGDRVRRRMARHEDRNAVLRSLLDTGDDELADILALRLNKEKELSRRSRRLAEELADTIAASMIDSSDPIVDVHWEDRDMAFLLRVARTVVAAAPRTCGLITASGDGGSIFVVIGGTDSGVELEEIGPRVAEMLDGRGGGRGEIFQGKAGTLERREEAVELLRP
jgi:alanyl-tRNA synthetase